MSRLRRQTTPNCQCPPRGHPWQSPVCNLCSQNALEAVCLVRMLLPRRFLWLAGFSVTAPFCPRRGTQLAGRPRLEAGKPERGPASRVEIRPEGKSLPDAGRPHGREGVGEDPRSGRGAMGGGQAPAHLPHRRPDKDPLFRLA